MDPFSQLHLLGAKSAKLDQENPRKQRLWKRFQRMASLPERDWHLLLSFRERVAGSTVETLFLNIVSTSGLVLVGGSSPKVGGLVCRRRSQ